MNLAQKFSLFQEYWQSKIVGELNEAHVKLVKFQGKFVWHHHEAEDKLFLVVNGRLIIRLMDGDVELEAGELVIIPRGAEHLPVARGDVQVLLLEPNTTHNTGNVENERTIESQWI